MTLSSPAAVIDFFNSLLGLCTWHPQRYVWKDEDRTHDLLTTAPDLQKHR